MYATADEKAPLGKQKKMEQKEEWMRPENREL